MTNEHFHPGHNYIRTQNDYRLGVVDFFSTATTSFDQFNDEA